MNISKTHKFPDARRRCMEEGGDLATFSDKNQTDYFLTPAYHNFRFGYRKIKSSKYISNKYDCKNSFFIYTSKFMDGVNILIFQIFES